jgi:hypothetical protein
MASKGEPSKESLQDMLLFMGMGCMMDILRQAGMKNEISTTSVPIRKSYLRVVSFKFEFRF